MPKGMLSRNNGIQTRRWNRPNQSRRRPVMGHVLCWVEKMCLNAANDAVWWWSVDNEVWGFNSKVWQWSLEVFLHYWQSLTVRAHYSWSSTAFWCYSCGTDSRSMNTWYIRQACLFSSYSNLATPLFPNGMPLFYIHLQTPLFLLMTRLYSDIYDAFIISTYDSSLSTNTYNPCTQ